jgi:hypothetical protein
MAILQAGQKNFKGGQRDSSRVTDSFGSNGTMPQMMNQYFSSDGGRLHRLIQDRVGPQVHLPNRLTRKQGKCPFKAGNTGTGPSAKTTEIINQFRWTLIILRSQLQNHFLWVKFSRPTQPFSGNLSRPCIKTGKDTESEGEQRKVATLLYDPVAAMARQLGDTSENVRSLVGKIPGSKVETILTWGSSGARGLNICH